jgi:hypothetical protein
MDPFSIFALGSFALSLLGVGVKNASRDELRNALNERNSVAEEAREAANQLNAQAARFQKTSWLSVITFGDRLSQTLPAKFEARTKIRELTSFVKKMIRKPDTQALDLLANSAALGAAGIELIQLVDYMGWTDVPILDRTVSDLASGFGLGDLANGAGVGDFLLADIASTSLAVFSAFRFLSNLGKAAEYDESRASVIQNSNELRDMHKSLLGRSKKFCRLENAFARAEEDVLFWNLIRAHAGQNGLPGQEIIDKNLDRATQVWADLMTRTSA